MTVFEGSDRVLPLHPNTTSASGVCCSLRLYFLYRVPSVATKATLIVTSSVNICHAEQYLALAHMTLTLDLSGNRMYSRHVG